MAQSSPSGSTANELALLSKRVAALEAQVARGLQFASASAPDDLAVLWRLVDDITALSRRLTGLEAHVTGVQLEALKQLQLSAGLRPEPPAGGQTS